MKKFKPFVYLLILGTLQTLIATQPCRADMMDNLMAKVELLLKARGPVLDEYVKLKNELERIDLGGFGKQKTTTQRISETPFTYTVQETTTPVYVLAQDGSDHRDKFYANPLDTVVKTTVYSKMFKIALGAPKYSRVQPFSMANIPVEPQPTISHQAITVLRAKVAALKKWTDDNLKEINSVEKAQQRIAAGLFRNPGKRMEYLSMRNSAFQDSRAPRLLASMKRESLDPRAVKEADQKFMIDWAKKLGFQPDEVLGKQRAFDLVVAYHKHEDIIRGQLGLSENTHPIDPEAVSALVDSVGRTFSSEKFRPDATTVQTLIDDSIEAK